MVKAGSGRRLLVIDDQESTRYILRRILTRAGYEVEEAATGSEGLTKALTSPDLIIADVNLPDMLGYDVCRRLKANPLTLSIPVLQMSASFTSDESRVQALEGGADSYMTQPVEPTVLLAQVSALLRLRKAEALSHMSALQWQSTFDALSDGLALADANGILIRTNSRFVQLLGMIASDLEGKPFADAFEQWFDVRLSDLLDHTLELSYGTRWFRLRYDMIRSDSEEIDGSILIITDITDHRKLQETLKLSEQLAATGRLAHVIAHEINNPLEAMSNLLYLALQGSVDQETKEYLEQASLELVRISQITKQVLAYHRSSKQPMVTDAQEILEGVLAMFRAHVGSHGVGLLSRLRCTGSVFVHPGEIRQVFSNLISNALDAIGNSHGTLSVRCFPATNYASNIAGVRFVFSDTGVGIPDDVLPHIFDAFYTTKQAKGSGIGLWLSAEVIGKHHGRIRVRTRTSGPYRGTLLDVFLPVVNNANLSTASAST